MLDTNHLNELPTEISQLRQLERLSISNNHLPSLPDSISNLQQLTALHAANNRLRLRPSVYLNTTDITILGPRKIWRDVSAKNFEDQGTTVQYNDENVKSFN